MNDSLGNPLFVNDQCKLNNVPDIICKILAVDGILAKKNNKLPNEKEVYLKVIKFLHGTDKLKTGYGFQIAYIMTTNLYITKIKKKYKEDYIEGIEIDYPQ